MESNPNNRDKVIVLLYATNFDEDKKVNEALDWLVEYTIKFRDVFSKIVAQAPVTFESVTVSQVLQNN